MRNIKILMLLMISALFVNCTQQKDPPNKQLLETSIFLTERLEYDMYSEDCTFIDSAVTEAHVIWQFFSNFEDISSFNESKYVEILEENKIFYVNQSKQFLWFTLLCIGAIPLILFIIVMRSKKSKIKSFNAMLLFLLYSVLYTGFLTYKTTVVYMHNMENEEIKNKIKQESLKNYFLENST